MKVWKFTLALKELQGIDMPKRSNILHVAEQFDTVCMWALVGDENDREIRTFRLVGTGHEFTPNMAQYVGTAIMRGGEFVWHVFEEARTSTALEPV